MLRRGLALGVCAALAGCGHMGLPKVAMPGSGNKGTAALLENRVWIDQDREAAKGTLRAFLTDGTLVMTSCVETYRLAPWRWVDGATLVWEEDGRNLRAEVALVEKESLALVIDVGDETITRRYKAARSPVVCPDLPK